MALGGQRAVSRIPAWFVEEARNLGARDTSGQGTFASFEVVDEQCTVRVDYQVGSKGGFLGLELLTTLSRRVLPAPVLLRPEDGIDRLGKWLRINRELRTGDARFDRSIYVESDVDDEGVSWLLHHASVRADVLSLVGEEPGKTLTVGDGSAGDAGATKLTLYAKSNVVGVAQLCRDIRGLVNLWRSLEDSLRAEAGPYRIAANAREFSARQPRTLRVVLTGIFVLCTCFGNCAVPRPPPAFTYTSGWVGFGVGLALWALLFVPYVAMFRGRSSSFTTVISLMCGSWEFSSATSAWTQLVSSGAPQARRPAAAFDPVRGKVTQVGGLEPSVGLPSVHELAGASWVERGATATPPSYNAPEAVYDLERSRLLLTGGLDKTDAGVLGSLWSLPSNTNQWSNVAAAQPQARRSFVMTYDSQRRRVVLFGGTTNTTDSLGDTWEWDGASWQLRTSATSPPPRRGACAAYDSRRGVTLVFGGRTSSLEQMDDGWLWNGSTWSPVPAGPRARRSCALTYDSELDAFVLYGGAAGNSKDIESLGDTWLLR